MTFPSGPPQPPAEDPEENSGSAPPSNDYVAGLRQIKRARSQLMVCFLTFPLYVMAVSALLGNGQDVGVLMLAYMALYAGFGINLSVRRCPRCHQQFFVKHYFLNPFPRYCVHCGLSCHHSDSSAL